MRRKLYPSVLRATDFFSAF